MPAFVNDPWGDGEVTVVAVDCHVSERPETLSLLGPDGRPLKVKPQPVGFDLRPAAQRKTERS